MTYLLRISLLSILLMLASCDKKDDISVNDGSYSPGGIGTSNSTGALVFKFEIPRYYSVGFVKVTLHDDANTSREVSGRGDREIRFSNIAADSYDYTLEFWAYSTNNDGVFTSYSFVNGQLTNSFGGFVDYTDVLNKEAAINKTVRIRSDQILTIDIDLN